MCGGNLYRFVSFQSFGYIYFSFSFLIFRSSIYIRLVGGCGGQHPLAAVDAMLSYLGQSLDRLNIGLCGREGCR